MNDNPRNNRSLVPVQQELATAQTLYGDQQQITEFAKAIQLVAPWAKKMERDDIGLIVRRALAMGVDPLNPHEVQIWVDKRGSVQFQLAYTLMAEWVRHFYGQHTEPRYEQLNDVDKEEEGLVSTCMAFRVSFIMRSDMAELRTLLDAGFQGPEARAMVTVVGLGVAHPVELSSPYFAPAGRSPAWKVRKRALVDAYRRKFGTPTRDELMELRRAAGRDQVQPSDWIEVAAETEEGLDHVDVAELAKMRAEARKRSAEIANMSVDERAEMVRANTALLHGDDDAINGALVRDRATDETLDRVADLVDEHGTPPQAGDSGPAVSVSDQVSIVLAAIEGLDEGDCLPPEANVAAQTITDETGLDGFKPPLDARRARALCKMALVAVGEAEDGGE